MDMFGLRIVIMQDVYQLPLEQSNSKIIVNQIKATQNNKGWSGI